MIQLLLMAGEASTGLFLKVLNMSISTLWLILAVIVLRLILKRSPKWIHVLFWALVAFRLICPVSLESALSLIPSAQTVAPEIMLSPSPSVDTGIGILNDAVNPIIQSSFTPKPYASANPLQILIPVSATLWLMGMATMLLYTLISYGSIRKKVASAIRVKSNIFRSEAVGSPFVLGIFKPRIYLPAIMDEQDIPHVIAHERAHIRRKDHWWKPLGFLILTVHWFNPGVWLAYWLLCRDIELACDEKVIRELGKDRQADYSQALLNCSIHRRSIASCPLAFGEVGVKHRVRNILHYKKPAFWVIVVALVLCAVVAVCFLTDPIQQDSPPSEAICWFDYLQNGTYPDAAADFQAQLPQYPGVTFRCSVEELTAETVNGSTILLRGMPIWNVFLCDLTGDGVSEFCATVSYGSGIIDEHIIVYDYATGNEYTLWDRGNFDYTLRLQDSVLLCDKYVYPHSNLVESGELMLVNAVGGDGMRLSMITEADKPEPDSFISFRDEDFSGVTSIKLSNAHNGNNTFLFDSEKIEAICAWLTTISGSNARNSKDWQYQGTYALTLMAGEDEVFRIVFGDDPVIFYGMYDDRYAMMYDLDRITIDEVVRFLGRFDDSNFDWGFEETSVVAETTPYPITSTIPYKELKGDIEYLQPGDIIGYGFLKEELQELGILLNNLMPEGFVTPVDYTPTMKVNLSWPGGKLTLYSDGKQTVVGEDGTWAVVTEDMNRFLNRFNPDKLAGNEATPLEEINPYYNQEQAGMDGCVTFRNNDLRTNGEFFASFAETVSHGAPIAVRTAWFTDEERFAISVDDILFDGEGFTWKSNQSGQMYEKHYQYLRHFQGEPESPNASYDAYDAYVLTNDRTATWEQLWNSLYSSQPGAAIEFTLVYMDYIYYPDHPSIPDCSQITLEFQGETLLTLTDTDALEALFAGAELTYEPKTYNTGPILRLHAKDGSELIIQLMLDFDWVIIDGQFYDFGPGYTDDGSRNALPDLFALLGIHNWPQEVMDAYPGFF